jgi:hypothetical protein
MKRYKLWALKTKDGRMLAYMENLKYNGHTIGAVIPGLDDAYYSHLIIGALDNAIEYLAWLKEFVPQSKRVEFQFSWDDVRIVRFKV